ncbi:MAG: tetratricopeptide repeat protein [Candidatus Omnitrophota bacterium]
MTRDKKSVTSQALLVLAATLFINVCAAGAEESLNEKLKIIESGMLEDGSYAKAAQDLKELLKESPGIARIHQDLGIALYGLMEYDKSIEIFRKSRRLDDQRDFKRFIDYSIKKIEDNRVVLDGLKGSNHLLAKAGEAERDHIVQKMAADHISVLENLTRERRYYPAMATAHVIWLKENAPFVTGIHRFSGDIYYSAMMYAMAEQEYKKAIEIEPSDPSLVERMADCLVAMGDFDAADEQYSQAVALYRERGIKGDKGKAAKIERIQRAMPKKYSDVEQLLKEMRYDDAEAVCKRRISLNPGDYVALTQLGQSYWYQDRKQEAFKLFNRAVKLVPDYPTAHFFLGRSYFFMRKYRDAEKEFGLFKKKMKLLPETDEATTDFYVSALRAISYYYSSRKLYAKTAKEYKEIISLKPDDQAAHYNLAVCYYNNRGMLSQAYRELEKVIEIDGTTQIADQAKFFIDYIRRNPDPRFSADFSFLSEY